MSTRRIFRDAGRESALDPVAPPEQHDQERDNLHWHALNYRTAATEHADIMWHELVACVERKLTAERERCSMKLDVTRAEVSLAAGEMTAQEWRTCSAVLRWMQARIRAA